MLKSARVPAAFAPPFEMAEKFVEEMFSKLERKPEGGTLHIGGERYVLMRAESFHLAWSDALASAFGEMAAQELLYNTAREIGRADCRSFCERLGVTDGVARLASGPIHFAHAGWALVEIHPDSAPATDDRYFLHYDHPNTFESEVARARGRKPDRPGCMFSAGYSAGWCSEAFGLEVHALELRCLACGDDACEFVMAPSAKLQEHAARVKAAWNKD